MPTISAFLASLCQIFWREHGPPHFHALYAEHEALIDIRTLEVMQGSLPKRALALVLEWASEHRVELMEDWDLCSRMQTPKKIETAELFRPFVHGRVARCRGGSAARLSLRVRFNDGTAGIVEMAAFINSDRAGVFAALRDEGLFRQARVMLGAVTWPGDLDLAPDAMHRAIKEQGKWIVG